MTRIRIIIPTAAVESVKLYLIRGGVLLLCVLIFPIAAHASPFDSGISSIQTLFTGTIAKAASLIAIVIGGYTVTSHSSQGLTTGRVLVNIDTTVHPELINTRFAYVSVSRASQDARIYTNEAGTLGERLSTNVTKTSAIDLQKAGRTDRQPAKPGATDDQ